MPIRRTRSVCCARTASGHPPQNAKKFPPPHASPRLEDGIVRLKRVL